MVIWLVAFLPLIILRVSYCTILERWQITFDKK